MILHPMLWNLVSNLQMTKTKPCKCSTTQFKWWKDIWSYSLQHKATGSWITSYRCKCLQVDLQKVSNIFTSLNNSNQSSNIKDLLYLGIYLTNQVVSKAKTKIGQIFKIYWCFKYIIQKSKPQPTHCIKAQYVQRVTT